MFSTEWAKNWRRVRYSQSFPQRPTKSDSNTVIPLITQNDWLDFRDYAVVLNCNDDTDTEHIRKMMNSDVVIRLSKRNTLTED